MNYKDTLNLPHTGFPMRANLPGREPDRLARWQQQDIYASLRKAREGQPKYVLHDGPPYANGQIHIGHAVNKVLKDIVCKVQWLQGKDVPYVPGWDCHGLPIEINVEKIHGKSGDKVDQASFRRLCRDYAQGEIIKQKKDFQRLGIIGDWDNPYTTMDFAVEAETIRALGRVIAKGNFRRGEKPVHWCFDCRSALAEAEIEYKDKTSSAIDVAFTFVDQDKTKQLLGLEAHSERLAAVIWTTTPWTIPANRALSFHPDFVYQAMACTLAGRPALLLLARDMATSCAERWGLSNWQPAGKAIRGSEFEQLVCNHPLYHRPSLCVLGSFVTLEAGTGIVHSAPAYGMDDFAVGARYGLETDNPVQDNGVYADSLAEFGGQHINKANPNIIQALERQHALVFHQPYQHSYPHCWRHKIPTIQRATTQWFIDLGVNQLGQRTIENLSKVQWMPDWGEQRMRNMVENRPDWCLSRQRSWGTPIPILYHKTTGRPHPRSIELIDTIAAAVEQGGIEAWFAFSARDLIGDEADEYIKASDTLDVWFDSGTTHQSVLRKRPELHFPADMYLEGSDQHRGWFQSSLLTSMCINDQPPYSCVLTHGFTVDAQRRKMSKSLGNIIAPQQIIDTWGADILRLWIASTDFKGEMSISDEILRRTADAYRRIRNTLRFLLGNTHDFTQAMAVPPGQMVALDAWMLASTARLQTQVLEHYLSFNYARVYQLIHHFCIVDLGAFYLDVLKDRLYTCATNSLARRSAQTVLSHMAHTLVRLIAPILSFTAEEVWAELHAAGRSAEQGGMGGTAGIDSAGDAGDPGTSDCSDKSNGTASANKSDSPGGSDTSGSKDGTINPGGMNSAGCSNKSNVEDNPGGVNSADGINSAGSLDNKQSLSSVFAATWQEQPQTPQTGPGGGDWRRILEVKTALNRLCESLRNTQPKAFGSLLDIQAELYLAPAYLQSLTQLGDELHFALLCSDVSLRPLAEAPEDALRDTELANFACHIRPSTHARCERCWHHHPSVGCIADHPGLCERCQVNLGDGETRRYV